MREDARLGFIGVIAGLVLFAWDRGDEQLARAGDVLGADAACEQAVMANAVKAGWQDMNGFFYSKVRKTTQFEAAVLA